MSTVGAASRSDGRNAGITVGAGLQRPVGKWLPFAANDAAGLAAALNGLEASIESWWSPHRWANHRRAQAGWLGSCALAADVDHYEGAAHAVVPLEKAAEVQEAALTGQLPGSVFHLTPRGFRLVFLLDAECTDRTAYAEAVAAVEHDVRCGLARAGLKSFRVDEVVTGDLARLLFAPCTVVGGIRRDAVVHVLRVKPYRIDSFKPRMATALGDAIARYNEQHRQVWPRSGGTCPSCGHHDCFGTLAEDADRWACFSSGHSGVGVAGEKCWHGDVLDLDAAALGVRPKDLLIRRGYLAPATTRFAAHDAIDEDGAVGTGRGGDADAITGEEIAARYVYVREQDVYFDPSTGAALTRASINSTHAADKARGAFATEGRKDTKPSVFIDERARQADNLGWWPGKSLLYEHDGKMLVNTFRPPSAPFGDTEPTLWLEHLEWLVPIAAERQHFLDVLAYNVQHIDGKVNHALVLGGGIRTGKDLLLQPLSKWLRSAYVNVKHEELDGSFTHYLKGAKFLTVQEARDLSFEQGFTRYNAFKTIIASPPDELSINEKFMRPYKMPNLVQVVFLTNYPNGVYFEDKGDGRYFVIWSPVEPREPAYYVRLGAYIDTSYMDVIGYLARRDISTFNPKALPPSTAAREEMHAATRSGAEAALTEVVEELADEMSVFTKPEMKAAAQRMENRALCALLDSAPARVGKALKDAGLESTKIKLGKWISVYWRRGSMDAVTAEQRFRERAGSRV